MDDRCLAQMYQDLEVLTGDRFYRYHERNKSSSPHDLGIKISTLKVFKKDKVDGVVLLYRKDVTTC